MVALYLVSVVPLDYAAMVFVPLFIAGVLLLFIVSLAGYRLIDRMATRRREREQALCLVRRYGVAVLIALVLDIPTMLAVYDDCWYWVCGWGWWS